MLSHDARYRQGGIHESPLRAQFGEPHLNKMRKIRNLLYAPLAQLVEQLTLNHVGRQCKHCGVRDPESELACKLGE